MAETITITPELEPRRAALLDKWVEQLDGHLDSRSGARPIAQTDVLQQIGSLLWEASGLDEERLRTAIDNARDEDGAAVRLIVTGQEKQHWPWELLYHGADDLGFVGRRAWCVVARRTSGSGRKKARATARPFRMLLFISSPVDLDAERNRLDFEREEELLFTAVDEPWSKGELDIDVAEDGVLDTLLDRLDKNQYHAVILSMHGAAARNGKGEEEWGLLFEDKDTGQGAAVAGSVLAAHFDKLPAGRRPGLVVLSACRSARAEESAESITDVARRLHEVGVERVLGMRLSVMDGAATAFSTELFRLLAKGEVLGRAVTLARDKVAQGAWLHQSQNGGKGSADGDPFGQWSLPVLLDRTTDGPVLDPEAAGEVIQRGPSSSVLIGDGTIEVPPRSSFIGRRTFIRTYLRKFLEGETPKLLLTGPGGVGKTTLAGLFARSLRERQPRTRLLGFQAPFDLGLVSEALRQEAFDGSEEPTLLAETQAEPDMRKRVERLAVSLASRERPCAFVLDNLESLQDMGTLTVPAEHEESRWFVETVGRLPEPTRVLLTGRYALPGVVEGGTLRCPVPDAPYGDVLRRMNRLRWPEKFDAKQKRWIHRKLGGNHRAIEWMAQLLTGGAKAEELVEALENVETPPGTPEEAVAVVLEALRQNLLFSQLRSQLAAGQDRLLRAATLYRVPVSADGLLALEEEQEQHEANRARLVDYGLLETGRDRTVDVDFFLVPPVVGELLGETAFGQEELRGLHGTAGKYHRFQGRYLSRRWVDDLEAIYHFRRAEEHKEADELAEGVCGFYHSVSSFAEAKRLTQEIVERDAPPAPWWAWNRYGMCQQTLGDLGDALKAHERALLLAPTAKEKGATLNNLSQIYDARGDYDSALRYLEESLAIRREIGDKAGEGATLNNLSQIYKARADYDSALGYLEQSLAICREIGDRKGEGVTLNNLSQIYKARADYDSALGYLEQSLAIRREIGDKVGEAATLNNLATTAHARGDDDRALRYLEESLAICREIGDREGRRRRPQQPQPDLQSPGGLRQRPAVPRGEPCHPPGDRR